MRGKDFLSVSDLDSNEVWAMVRSTERMKAGSERPLEGKIFALLFEMPSLRTRVSFEVGVRQLGGECIYLSKDDVGLGVREPVADVARVLDRWVDGIIARVYSHRSLEILAENTSAPVINALSDLEHPCQAIGDMCDDLGEERATGRGPGGVRGRWEQRGVQPGPGLLLGGGGLHTGRPAPVPDSHGGLGGGEGASGVKGVQGRVG